MVLNTKNMFYTKKACLNRVLNKNHVCLLCLLGSEKRGFARLYVQTCFQVLNMFIHVYLFPGGVNFKTKYVFGEL
jgi:hypothetical protein